MTYDASKVYYITTDTIDKILYESPVISNSYSGGGTSSPDQHDFSVAHSFGQSVIANGMFSINGNDYYPCGTSIPGAVSGISLEPQFVLCDIYADSSNVHVCIDNGFDATQTISIYYEIESLQ